MVEHPDGSVVESGYNGDGLRVWQDDDGTITRFVHDGNNILQETDDTGVVTAEYTYQPGEYGLTISQHRDGDSSFHHFDGISNTAGLTDGTGTVTDEYQFDAFGESRGTTGATPNPHTYKGEFNAYYKDPLAGPGDSIYSLHHRQYEATTGRFKSQDPIADDLNLYRYVSNNPVNEVDPSGLEEEFVYGAEKRSWIRRAVGDVFSWDTLHFLTGYDDRDHDGKFEPINGGVHEQFAKDQATNLSVAIPYTRVPVLIGAGVDLSLQGLGQVDDYINERPQQPLDLGRTQDIALTSAVLGPLASRFKLIAGPLYAYIFVASVDQGVENFSNGNYFEGAGDLLLAGLSYRNLRGNSATAPRQLSIVNGKVVEVTPKFTMEMKYNPFTGLWEVVPETNTGMVGSPSPPPGMEANTGMIGPQAGAQVPLIAPILIVEPPVAEIDIRHAGSRTVVEESTISVAKLYVPAPPPGVLETAPLAKSNSPQKLFDKTPPSGQNSDAGAAVAPSKNPQTVFDEISKFRDELGGIPTTKKPVKPDGGTLAYLDEAGTYGISAHGQNQAARMTWKGVIDANEQTLFHGEGDVFTQLRQSGWKGESGRTYRLFVHQTGKKFVCPSCDANMASYMKGLGIENLDVFLVDGTKFSYRVGSPTPIRGTWK